MKKIILVMAFVALTAISAKAENNLIADPGFEDQGQGAWINYDFGPEFGREYNAADEKHDGKQSLKLWATGKTNDPKKWEMSGAKQVFPIKPGEVINGGAWLKWEGLNGGEKVIEYKWHDSDKKELGGGIGTVHKTDGAGNWEYQDLNTWTPLERTAPERAAYVDFRLTLLAPGSADIAKGMVWWDDAQITIEKPASNQ